MTIRINEGWMSSNGAVLAVKKKNGGYVYFVSGYLMVNRQNLQDHPLVAREISSLNLEIMEAKK